MRFNETRMYHLRRRELIAGALGLIVQAGCSGGSGTAGGSSADRVLGPQYFLTPIKPLSGDTAVSATGLNNLGWAAGSSANVPAKLPPVPVQIPRHAILKIGPVARTLPTLAGDENNSSAIDVNDAGTVVGVSGATPVLWEGATFAIRAIPGLTGLTEVRPLAINNNGALLAASRQGSFLWSNGSVTLLPSNFTANSFNDSSGVAGSVQQKPVLWQNGVVTPLPLLPLDDQTFAVGGALAINAAGVTVGTSEVRLDAIQFEPHAVVWQNGQVTDLNSLIQPLAITSSGTDINSHGDIIIDAAGTHYLYKGGDMHAVKDLVPAATAWSDSRAILINDRGEILITNSNGAAIISPNSLL